MDTSSVMRAAPRRPGRILYNPPLFKVMICRTIKQSRTKGALVMTNPAGKSLYARLGGYDALAAAVDDLIPRLHGDPQIGAYWKGQNTHTKKRSRQLVLDFLVAPPDRRVTPAPGAIPTSLRIP
mgnify:CR=1 FL=1